MSKSTSTVVLDSSGLISLVKVDDELHGKAEKITELIATQSLHLILPYEVLAETLNAIGKLVSKQSAILVGEAVLEQYSNQEINFVQSEPHIIAAALKLLVSASGSPSFIDCLVMAVANENNTNYIFGFDDAFRKNGYLLPRAVGS